MERDDLVAGERGGTQGVVPQVMDPCLELFGFGWSPTQGSVGDAGYRGRHRAEN